MMLLFVLFCVLSMALFAGCSVGFTEQAEIDRATALMNQRRYAEAAEILEGALARKGDRRTAWLLAHAELGMGGFELFGYASAVFGKQATAGPFDYAVDRPDCDRGEIKNVGGHDIRCLTLRMARHTPDAEEAHFRRARDLFRSYFPDEASSPLDVNFLAAVVEIGSSFSRMRALLRRSGETPPETMIQQDERFAFTVRNSKRFFEEVVRGFKRASWSYRKVSNFVVTLDGMPIVRSGRAELVFNEEIGFPAVLRFAADVMHEEARGVDRELNLAAEGYLGVLPRAAVRVFEMLDRDHMGSATAGALRTAWKFESLLRRLLSEAAKHAEGGESRFSFFELIWSNPPALAKGLSRAVHAAWQTESPQPLRDFYLETQDEWKDLEGLAGRWKDWLEEKLSDEQVRFIEKHLVRVLEADPRLLRHPSLAGEEGRVWFRDLVGALGGGMQAVLSAEIPEPPAFESGQIEEGQRLLDDSLDWVSRNLWEVE